jgi:hypothetical protein
MTPRHILKSSHHTAVFFDFTSISRELTNLIGFVKLINSCPQKFLMIVSVFGVRTVILVVSDLWERLCDIITTSFKNL